MKTHLHVTQLDEHFYPYCGRGNRATLQGEFEATPQTQRCKICDRNWFPDGQPKWHFDNAVKQLKRVRK